MIVTIHQPNLFPRLKTLQKIALSDIWVVLDNVQFEKREYQNRMLIVPNHNNQIPFWCTMPVYLKNGRNTRINEIEVDVDNFLNYFQKVVNHSFKKSECLKRDFEELFCNIAQSEGTLVDVCVNSTIGLLKFVECCPEIIYASELDICGNDKSERLAEVCKKIGADTYLSDSGGAHYIDENVFYKKNINIVWHAWKPLIEKSSESMKEFLRNSSSINLLARSEQEFINVVLNCVVSKKRIYAEEKNECTYCKR